MTDTISQTLWNRVNKELGKAKANYFLTIINDEIKIFELAVEGKPISYPVEVADALNNYFADSVATIVESFTPEHKGNITQVIQFQPDQFLISKL